MESQCTHEEDQIFGDITKYQDYYKAIVMNTIVSYCKDTYRLKHLKSDFRHRPEWPHFPCPF